MIDLTRTHDRLRSFIAMALVTVGIWIFRLAEEIDPC